MRAMRGNPDVVARLVTYLRTELTGHRQHMPRAAPCHRAGYERLAERQAAYSDEESRRPRRLLHRVLLLGGAPELSGLAAIDALGGERYLQRSFGP